MFCAYTIPRYQVSVYRTIGPLVLGCGSYDFPRLLIKLFFVGTPFLLDLDQTDRSNGHPQHFYLHRFLWAYNENIHPQISVLLK